MLRQGFANARLASTVATTRDDAQQRRGPQPPLVNAEPSSGDNRQAGLLLAGTF